MLESGSWRIASPNSLYAYLREPCGLNGTVFGLGSNEEYPPTKQALIAYHIATDTWTELTQMPSVRYYCFTAAVQGKVYVMGGTSSFANHEFYNSLSTVEIYDLQTGDWSTGADMPVAAANGGVAIIGDKIYCINGAATGKNTEFLKAVQIYDTQSDSWSMGVDAPAAANAPNCTAVGTDIYLTGFMDSATGTTATSYRYDTIADQWSAAVPQLTQACHSATGYYNGKVLCAGGVTGAWGTDPVDCL